MSIPSLNPLGQPNLSAFGGKVPNPSANIKQFYAGDNSSGNTWYYTNKDGHRILTPTIQSKSLNVVVPGDLIVKGAIYNLSDRNKKANIQSISREECDKIIHLEPKTYHFKDDTYERKEYGLIAQEVEEHYPLLVNNNYTIEEDNEPVKVVNYYSMIPLLIGKIKIMQEEMDALKEQVKVLSSSSR